MVKLRQKTVFMVAVLLLALCMLSFGWGIGKQTIAHAASGRESESNNTAETANIIQVNSSITGNISKSGDIDWFKFTTQQDGYFNVNFEHVFLSSTRTYWKIFIYDSTGVNNITGGTSSYFSSIGNENSSSYNYGIPAGSYYIKVVQDYFSDNDYTIRVNFTSTNDWETENNNNKESADALSLNKSIGGALSSSGDVDWFTFSTSQAGYFNVSFNHTLLSSTRTYWKIYIYDSTGVNNITGGMDSYFSATGSENSSSLFYGIPSGTYYIKVVQDYYSGNDYSLQVNFYSSNDWETENNNSKEKANIIRLNQPINGALSASGDTDWYKFETNSSCEIAISFSHEVLNSTRTYWKIYIYDNSGVTERLSYGRRGDTSNAISDYISVSAGTYFVKVVQDYYSGVNYSLTILEKHEHRGIWEKATAPTCTAGGTEQRTCTVCGTIDTREVDALGHAYDNGKVIKEAGIAQKGETQFTCTICGEQYIEKDGHLLWVIPVICVGGVLVIVGIVNYVIILKKKRR